METPQITAWNGVCSCADFLRIRVKKDPFRSVPLVVPGVQQRPHFGEGQVRVEVREEGGVVLHLQSGFGWQRADETT